jgi:hypothetical protein
MYEMFMLPVQSPEVMFRAYAKLAIQQVMVEVKSDDNSCLVAVHDGEHIISGRLALSCHVYTLYAR